MLLKLSFHNAHVTFHSNPWERGGGASFTNTISAFHR